MKPKDMPEASSVLKVLIICGRAHNAKLKAPMAPMTVKITCIYYLGS